MRPDRLYLLDMLTAADAIGRFIHGVDPGRFTDDELLQSAVLQKLTVIGEAAARLSSDLVASHPDVEWRLAIGLRNIVVHAYFSVDWATIWQTATQDVPSLARRIQPILATLPDD